MKTPLIALIVILSLSSCSPKFENVILPNPDGKGYKVINRNTDQRTDFQKSIDTPNLESFPSSYTR